MPNKNIKTALWITILVITPIIGFILLVMTAETDLASVPATVKANEISVFNSTMSLNTTTIAVSSTPTSVSSVSSASSVVFIPSAPKPQVVYKKPTVVATTPSPSQTSSTSSTNSVVKTSYYIHNPTLDIQLQASLACDSAAVLGLHSTADGDELFVECKRLDGHIYTLQLYK